jgi:hypothetical protein
MKLTVGVMAIVFGYALLYQGMFMARVYRPATGDFLVGVPPLAVLLGFVTIDTRSTEPAPATMNAPFSWGS